MVTTAPPPEAHPRDGLQPVPGLGPRLRLGLVYERQDRARVPRGQACVSEGRGGPGAQAAAGQREGPSGTKRGHASLTWALSDAALLGLRHQPAGQK